LNTLCALSASFSFSRGLSLGSWLLKDEAIMEISRKQFLASASMMIRESLGSMGILAIMRPMGVSSYSGCEVSVSFLDAAEETRRPDGLETRFLRRLMALSSRRSLKPSWILFSLGGSIKGNLSTVPIFRKSILSMTSARFERRISGLV